MLCYTYMLETFVLNRIAALYNSLLYTAHLNRGTAKRTPVHLSPNRRIESIPCSTKYTVPVHLSI
jgi:hypothetical protein